MAWTVQPAFVLHLSGTDDGAPVIQLYKQLAGHTLEAVVTHAPSRAAVDAAIAAVRTDYETKPGSLQRVDLAENAWLRLRLLIDATRGLKDTHADDIAEGITAMNDTEIREWASKTTNRTSRGRAAVRDLRLLLTN